jgi:N4-(beta-N-acetylglucosaminyl)-L-asparaginase
VFGQAPAVQSGGIRPVVVASANGNRYKNGGPVTGVQRAFEMMAKGADVLDAVVAGVNLCELDPEDTSVGYGGLPNAEASSSSTRAACTARPNARAPSPASKASARRRSSPKPCSSRPTIT